MIKKLTFSVVLLTMFILTSNFASANTYVKATSNAVGHIKGFHQDENVTPEETQKFAPVVQKTKAFKTPLGRTLAVQISAYTSTPDQTDASPFITANGEHVYWGGVNNVGCNTAPVNVFPVSCNKRRSVGLVRS